jgi:diaminopimelate decarboxylase
MGITPYESVLRSAIAAGYLGPAAPLAGFVDIAGVKRTIRELHDAFPEHFEHAFAAKANPMSQALALVKEAGMSCEVASPGELEQAFRAGFAPENIVYDEPAKTNDVFQRVLSQGIHLNLDNFQEFDRVSALMQQADSRSRIGFRINPQVGAGQISAMSTATTTSKFGVTLEDEGNRCVLVQAYGENPWLTSLHTHIGSQGCSLDLMISGIRKVVDLAEEINSKTGGQQVELIDIGGGLPVNFESEEVSPTFAGYSAELNRQVPELFSGKYRVKTEFVRSVYAKNGFIATLVEYTKISGRRRIALTHAGAQVATRTVFMPEHWKIRVSVFDSAGRARQGEAIAQDIAGPLCFAGDMIATERLLPKIEQGDIVVLHDTGAYYFSNPFYYNALPACAVYGLETGDDNSMDLVVWRQRQSVNDMLAVLG